LPYNAADLQAIKSVPGHSFRKTEKLWAVPADMTTARQLRKLFGDRLKPSRRMLQWGRQNAVRERNLSAISTASDFDPEQMRLTKILPELAATMDERWKHQRADVAFMARTDCINANEQGTGKTRAVIGAVYEAELESGAQLVIAPVSAIESTWAQELERWVDMPILASEDPGQRKLLIKEAEQLHLEGKPFWLVLNKEMVRYEAIYEQVWDEDRRRYRREECGIEEVHPELFQISWASVTVDEFHKVGLSNPKTLGARAITALETQRKWAVSGTPMMGKPINLWGVLRWFDKKTFSSKWRWAGQWLEITEDFSSGQKRQAIGGIKAGREDAFYAHLAPYMVRRLKSEVFPDLPLKQYEDVWCDMTPTQLKQYDKFAADAEVRIEEHYVRASNVLSEYARLKLFATAYCEVEGHDVICHSCQGTGEQRGYMCYDCLGEGLREKLKLKPTFDSGKFPRLLEKLHELGVTPGNDTLGALVGSQHRETVVTVARYLEESSYRVGVILGGSQQKRSEGTRRQLVEAFQTGGPGNPQIIVATLEAGGVSLTLDRADSVHILDETWLPDTQEQFEDRTHRGSKIHQVKVLYYRSKETLEQYIKEVNDEKAWANWDILDLRRQGFRATRKGQA